MVGRLRFTQGQRDGQKMESIYGLPVYQVQTDPEGLFGPHRLRRAGRHLHRKGIVRTLLPRDFEGESWMREWALRPVDPAPLLREQATALAVEALHRQGAELQRSTVALCGTCADRAMARAAVRLCEQVRHLIIAAPEGGERLAHWLRWEYGIPVLPPKEGAQVALQFQPGERREEPTLELYGRRPDLGGIRPVMPALGAEEQDDLSLLSLLWEWGKLDPDALKFT